MPHHFMVAALALLLPLPSLCQPKPPGKLVDLGGHRLHVYCTGRGTPTVVVENGLGDFSFDWVLVQIRVSRLTRVCTYDRAGYAWSNPGPKPRTFAQLNLELHDALAKLGEHGPFCAGRALLRRTGYEKFCRDISARNSRNGAGGLSL